MGEPGMTHDYDVLVIGSGFGGSVTALRLTEKGYRVGVLEAGRRFGDADLPKTSWDARKFLWAPRLGCKGIQRIHLLRNVIVLAGAGVGGGSLVYANTLYEPQSAFYADPQWAHITDWHAELAPYYDQAQRMLGVARNPTMTPSDEVLRDVAEEMGVGHTFSLTPVGVFFGRDDRKEPGREASDPYFGGAGPSRRGCIECGECMTGCRHNAKNSLVKNYLYLAERAGAVVHPETTVVAVRPSGSGYTVDTVATGAWRARRTARSFTAGQVVFAAGTWGTQQLLHRMRAGGVLPGISARLGVLTRTNSEALGGALTGLRSRKEQDFTRGVAITSSIHPDASTSIEPVRYGKGSNAMGLLSTLMTDGGGKLPRGVKWLAAVARHPGRVASLYAGMNHWSERAVIGLTMQARISVQAVIRIDDPVLCRAADGAAADEVRRHRDVRHLPETAQRKAADAGRDAAHRLVGGRNPGRVRYAVPLLRGQLDAAQPGAPGVNRDRVVQGLHGQPDHRPF